jgi:hypothetical protein
MQLPKPAQESAERTRPKARIGPEQFNGIANICYLVARENQSVGQSDQNIICSNFHAAAGQEL